MKNYKNHIRSRFKRVWKNTANQYCESVVNAQKYLSENNIVYQQSGCYGTPDLRISFQNKSDMLLFLILYGDEWEHCK